MTTIRPRDLESNESSESMPTAADDWIRQFIKHVELEFADASRSLPHQPSSSELQHATARALLATFVDSGMQAESVLELFGQIAVDRKPEKSTWNDALNERRITLIDSEIQGTITPAERLELAGLTKMLREQVDSETSLPMHGARALHRRLLQLKSKDKSV